jgi:hypothetical protein
MNYDYPPWNGYGTPPSSDYEYPQYGTPPMNYDYPPWNGYGTPPSGDYEYPQYGDTSHELRLPKCCQSRLSIEY